MAEQKDKFKKIKDKLKHPRATSLNIKRVPADIVKVFKEYANEEFVGDYGMMLKTAMEGYIEYRKLKKILLEKGEVTLRIKVKRDD